MKKVMVIDDNPISSFMIKSILNENEVIEINNTNDIYDEIKNNNPDLLLLDIIMPNLSGFDILKKIKNDFNMIVIIVSSLSSEEAKKKAYELGADMFITKPFRLDFLKNVIKEKLLYIN